MNLKGRVAVVTGAGSGIGRATSISLARRGCHLALADINEFGLTQTVDEAISLGVALGGSFEQVSEEEVQRQRALADYMLRMPPKKAGEIIVRGIERRKARILVGTDAKIVSLLERIAPVRYWTVLKKGFPE